ncbi:MAG TPA: thiolase domain-containing protein [Gammaproteobacteria bacterium]|nr:thiolase domain-containing protein [Gammaproteobacteria bacterium]
MRDVYIVGVGQTPVSKETGVRNRYRAATAVQAALAEAGIEPKRVGALYVGNMMSGLLANQQQLGGLIADYAGLAGIEAFTVEAACASGGAAARVGYLAVAGGAHDIVVVCGLERMTHVDRDTVTRALATAADQELDGVGSESFLSLNAQLMRAYMDKYRVRAEDFAPFAVTAHRNAVTNPNALLRKQIDVDGYLASRVVSDPVRLLDASPICDGSAALVLASGEAAATLQSAPRVRVDASAAATAPLALSRRSDPLKLEAVEASTERALAQARVKRRDLDLFELHDAYTIMSILTLESGGFANPGTASRLAAEGRIDLDGDLPIATFGGLKARGHPVGATGCYQLVEAYLQLTAAGGANQVRDAELALVQNIGGTGATVVSHVLRRVA